jgi:hypothetical protein
MSPRAAPDATPEEIEVASSLLVLAASSAKPATSKRSSEGTSQGAATAKSPKSVVDASPSSERGDDESSNVAAPRAARAPGDADVTSNAALVAAPASAASDNVPYNARNAPSSAFPARLKAA